MDSYLVCFRMLTYAAKLHHHLDLQHEACTHGLRTTC